MLDTLRVFSKSWLAMVLIALLVVSFAIFGISGSLIFGAQNTVVQVGDTEVDVNDYRFAYENQLNALSQTIGRRLSREEANAFGIQENVLTQVISGAVLDENARKMGLGLSDESVAEEIANDERFRDLSGQFSATGLRSSLARLGISEQEYIESRRRDSRRNQILNGTAASLSLPDEYAKALALHRGEKRVFDHVTIGKEVASDIPTPGETDLSTYFEANKADFLAPSYRKLAILKLEPTDLMKPEEVSEEEVLSAYEERRNNLRTPERRQIEQLVLENRAAGENARQRLEDGASFEEVVKESGKTLQDIDLGLLRRDELPDENIAAAAFSATLNEPTDIIDGLFGPVIIRVSRIEEETTTPFEEVSETLRQQIAADRAVEDVFSNFDAVEDERGAGETVLEAGKRLNLETRIIEMIDANGLDGEGERITDVPRVRELVRLAFEAQPGDDTQAIEIGDNGFLWYEVLEIIPERQKPLEEVRDAVADAWLSAETDKAVKAMADKVADRLRSGEDFNTVLAELLPKDSLGTVVTASTTEPLQRDGQSADFPSQAVRAGFAEKADSVNSVNIGDNREIVFRVAEIQGAGIAGLADNETEQIDLIASQDMLSQVVEDLKLREPVNINRNAIGLAFSP